MENKWRRSTWGDEISLEYGKRLSGYEDGPGPVPVFGANGRVGWTTSALAEGPGVILGRKGVHRGVEYSEIPFFVIDTAYFVKPKRELSMRWLYYAMQHHKLGEIDDGSPIPSTTRSAVYVRPLEVPPLGEQSRMAGVLGAFDDKIELNWRMNRTLEKMAAAIFKSWFIDFDPVNAKAEGRDTNLPAEIADLFPDGFEDSELGPIPKGWDVSKLGDLIELAYGKSLRAQDRKPGPVAVYGSNGRVGWHDTVLVPGPGIVVGRKGNPGIVTWSPAEFFPIDTTFYVIPIGLIHSLYFLFHALKNHNLASLGADSAVPGLNRNMAYMSQQVVPTSELVDVFDSFVKPVSDRIYANERQDRRLAGLRETLLPKLLSGEIEVPEAETIAKEAAP